MSNKLELTLPTGNEDNNYSLSLIVTIRNIYGSTTKITQNIQVFPINENSNSLNKKLQQASYYLKQRGTIKANTITQCLSIEENHLTQYNDNLLENLLILIEQSLEINCSPIIIRYQIRSLKYLSFSKNFPNYFSKFVQILSNHVECFIGSSYDSFFDATIVSSNLFDLNLNSHNSHEVRCFIEIIRNFRSFNRVCGEILDDIITNNIQSQSIINFSQKMRNSQNLIKYSFDNDDVSSILISPSTFNEVSLPNCIVSDFAIYSKDAFNLDDDE